jgi:hypothetical protein
MKNINNKTNNINMKLWMYNLVNGKPYITIESYHSGDGGTPKINYNIVFASIKIPFTRLQISLRKKDITEFTAKGISRLDSIFGKNSYKTEGFTIYKRGKTNSETNNVYRLIDFPFILNPKYDFIACKSNQVVYSKKLHKYYGFSHRGGAFFGIGDMLFDENNENISLYYENKQFRKLYLKCLKRYINDAFDFENVINSGIKYIVPFKCRGKKIIEDMQEAYVAACNFAKYVS